MSRLRGVREVGYCPTCGRLQGLDHEGRMLAHQKIVIVTLGMGTSFSYEPCDGKGKFHTQHEGIDHA